MKKIMIIGPSYLKDNTTINLNVEDKLIKTAILDAQVIKIEPILGTKLYNKIMELLSNEALVEPYKTLLDEYVVPALLQWSISYTLTNTRFKITNKTAGAESSWDTAPMDLEHFKFLVSSVENKAAALTQKMIIYLKANRDDFPEYVECQEKEGGTSPRLNGFRNPISFY